MFKKDGCYKEGAKTKYYSISIKSDYFKEHAKERYKIEANNSELKHQQGYDVVTASGLIGMQIQGVLTIFTVNGNRIMKLKDESNKK